MTFIPPFDDIKVIEGQGTVGVEILEDLPDVDAVIMPIGGGRLSSGVSYYLRKHAPQTKLYGVEPAGAASLQAAIAHGAPVELDKVNKFADGAAGEKVGELNYEMSGQLLDAVKAVPEGEGCATISELYNEDANVAEHAGAVPIAAFEF